MKGSIHSAVLVGTMAVVTMFLRFLPFLVFRKGRKTPAYIAYLGRVLPQAIIGMLVIYCLKDVSLNAPPYGLPELLSSCTVVALQCWRRNACLSILSGTVVYMLLIRLL